MAAHCAHTNRHLRPGGAVALAPGFSRVESDGVTVPYNLLVQGYPPVTLFGSRHWTMSDFCHDAAIQLTQPPTQVHFLTVPLPGLDSPQILVVEPGQADTGTLFASGSARCPA